MSETCPDLGAIPTDITAAPARDASAAGDAPATAEGAEGCHRCNGSGVLPAHDGEDAPCSCRPAETSAAPDTAEAQVAAVRETVATLRTMATGTPASTEDALRSETLREAAADVERALDAAGTPARTAPVGALARCDSPDEPPVS